VSRSGSDWQDYLVIDLATKKTLADKARGQGVACGGNGFFYSGIGPEAQESRGSTRITRSFHTIGTPHRPTRWSTTTRRTRSASRCMTEDERFGILTISDRGRQKGNAVRA
jgi:hypothetical protein